MRTLSGCVERTRLRVLWRAAGYGRRADFLRAVNREESRLAEHDERKPRSLSGASLHRIETGSRAPEGDTLAAIARALRVPVGRVLGLAVTPQDVRATPVRLELLSELVQAASAMHQGTHRACDLAAWRLGYDGSCLEALRGLAAELASEMTPARGELFDMPGDGEHLARVRAISLTLAWQLEGLCDALPRMLRIGFAPSPSAFIAQEIARQWRNLARAAADVLRPCAHQPSAWWGCIVAFEAVVRASWLLDRDASAFAMSAALLGYRALDLDELRHR